MHILYIAHAFYRLNSKIPTSACIQNLKLHHCFFLQQVPSVAAPGYAIGQLFPVGGCRCGNGSRWRATVLRPGVPTSQLHPPSPRCPLGFLCSGERTEQQSGEQAAVLPQEVGKEREGGAKRSWVEQGPPPRTPEVTQWAGPWLLHWYGWGRLQMGEDFSLPG